MEVPVKKAWKKPERSFMCGYCEECGKQLISDAGGWIVTATKKYFCHDGKDGSCFDNYCEQQKLRSEDATYEKEK